MSTPCFSYQPFECANGLRGKEWMKLGRSASGVALLAPSPANVVIFTPRVGALFRDRLTEIIDELANEGPVVTDRHGRPL